MPETPSFQHSRLLICWVVLATITGREGKAEDYALVVGVNDCSRYQLPDGTRPRPLRGAETDAVAVAALLRERGFGARNIHLITGTKATRDAIRAALGEAATRVHPTDRFLLYFAGHGTQVADRAPYDEPDRLDEALCASDADEHGAGLVLDDDLSRWLEEVDAGQVIVILDCCHSGSATKDADDDLASRFLPAPVERRREEPAAWRELRTGGKGLGRRTAAFFACKPDQQAYERRLPGVSAPARSGQFTHFLLEGLRGTVADTNRDGIVTNRELVDYTTRRLDASFNRHRASDRERQQPDFDADTPDAAVLNPLSIDR